MAVPGPFLEIDGRGSTSEPFDVIISFAENGRFGHV